MIPDEVLKQVKNLNPLVEFHEFDTGHGIKSEAFRTMTENITTLQQL